MKNKINQGNNKWKTIKQINNKQTITTPTDIRLGPFNIKNTKFICNIANNHYIQKIKNIRSNFKTFNISPLQILTQLISRNKNNFLLPQITIKDTIKIIKELKSSHSTGHDLLSSYILKKYLRLLPPPLLI